MASTKSSTQDRIPLTEEEYIAKFTESTVKGRAASVEAKRARREHAERLMHEVQVQRSREFPEPGIDSLCRVAKVTMANNGSALITLEVVPQLVERVLPLWNFTHLLLRFHIERIDWDEIESAHDSG